MSRAARITFSSLLLSMVVHHACAHHSIARFDGRRVVRISGVVTGFRWINPHASIQLAGLDESGRQATQWNVEMQAPTALMADGWRKDSLSAGDQVTIFANPLRDAAPATSQQALYLGIILPGGKSLGRVDGQTGEP